MTLAVTQELRSDRKPTATPMRKLLHLVVASSLCVAALTWSSRADAALSVYHLYIVWLQGQGEANRQSLDSFVDCLLSHSTYVDYWSGNVLVVPEGSYVVPKPSGALGSTSAVAAFVTQLINDKVIPAPPSYGTPIYEVMDDPTQTPSGLVNGVGGLNDKGTVLGKPAGLIINTTNPKGSAFWSLRTALSDETVATQHEVAEVIDTLRGGQGCCGDFCCEGWCNSAPSCGNMDGLQCPGAPAKTFTGSSSCGSVNGWLVQTLSHQGAKTCTGTVTCDFALATSCPGQKATLHAPCAADSECCAGTVCRKWTFSGHPDDPPADVCCKAAGASCTTGTDCCGAMACDATTHACSCVAKDASCANDDDCCSGLTCQTGSCALAPPPPPPDAGAAVAAPETDASEEADGGPGIPLDDAGCSCRVAAPTRGAGIPLGAAVVALLVSTRRRRSRRLRR